MVNVLFGYESDNWSINVWVCNLFDEDVLICGFEFGNDLLDGYIIYIYI